MFPARVKVIFSCIVHAKIQKFTILKNQTLKPLQEAYDKTIRRTRNFINEATYWL
jgi:hypothetical protein